MKEFLFASIILFMSFALRVDAQNVVTDRDGNSYPTVEIANQLWMVKNLVTTHYPDGKEIPSYCYDNDSAYCEIYGRLYPWSSLVGGKRSDSLLNVCPEGWHVPSDSNWKALFDRLGGPVPAGVKLRRSKKSNFNFQWGGNYHHELGIFSFIDRKTYLWSATSYSNSAAWMVMTGTNTKNMNRSTVPKEYSFSVRCVKTP